MCRRKSTLVLCGIGMSVGLLLVSCHWLGTSDNHYYVSPDGRDWARGTEAHPWETLTAAAERAQPGDTIHVLAGTYGERLWPAVSGTAGNPITFIGHDAVLDGSTVPSAGEGESLDWSGIVYLPEHEYIVVTGFEIVNCDFMGIYVRASSNIELRGNTIDTTNTHGIGVYESSDIVVSENTLEAVSKNGPSAGIWIEDCSAFEVSDNILNDVGTVSGGGEAEGDGIVAVGGITNGLISGNVLDDVAGCAITLPAGGQGDIESITIDGNTISNSGSGIDLFFGAWDSNTPTFSDVTISGNTLTGTVGTAINSLIQGDSYVPLSGVGITGNRMIGQDTGIVFEVYAGPRAVDDIEIANNLVVESDDTGIAFRVWYSDTEGSPVVTDATIVNNTVVDAGGVDGSGGVAEVDGYWDTDPGDNGPDVTVGNNIFTGGDSFSLSVAFSTVTVDYNLFTEFIGAYGETHGTNPVEAADPGFTDSANDDYSLASASPARNAGLAAYAPAVDIVGTTRPQGAAVDIGAFEYVE